MPASKTDICNMALSRIGANLITDFDGDQTREAQLCRLLYGQARDEVLARIPWRFAEKQADLGAQLLPVPQYGFSYRFQLPPDTIRVIETSLGDDEPWKVVGDNLYANVTGVKITYTARIENTSLYPPLFTAALANRLAAYLAMSVGDRDADTVRAMIALYEAALFEGAAVDGQQATETAQVPEDLIRVREE